VGGAVHPKVEGGARRAMGRAPARVGALPDLCISNSDPGPLAAAGH